MRETSVKPLGLVTQPNKYGQYPIGALSRAENIVMRAAGRASQLPARKADVSVPATFLNHAWGLYSTSAQQQLLFFDDGTNTQTWWVDGSTHQTAPFEDTSLAVPYAYSTPPLPVTFRDRTVINSDYGILAADYVTPTSTPKRTLRYAGLTQPIIGFYGVNEITVGTAPHGFVLRPGEVVAYGIVVRRVYGDATNPDPYSYELISDPSPFQRIKNNFANDANVAMAVNLGPNSSTMTGRVGLRVGDLVEVYRTLAVPSATAGLNTDAGVTLFLAKTIVITAGDLVTNSITFDDDTNEAALGRELYTNPGQQSLQGVRRRPPLAKAIGVYQGFTFYGSLTNPAKWEARWPQGLGQLTGAGSTIATRRFGVGRRDNIAGDTHIGTGVIDGISSADMVGLAVGQRVKLGPAFGPYASDPTITVVGANQITVNLNASANSHAVFTVNDVLEIDGQVVVINDLNELLTSIARLATPFPFYTATTGETVAYHDNAVPSNIDYYALTFTQSLALEPYRPVQGNIAIRGSNGANYDPPIPTMSQAARQYAPTPQPNRLAWSWDQQPEAVSPGAVTPVGRGEIIAVQSNRNTLWIFCTDGLYRLTGFGGGRSSGLAAQWSTELIDPSFVLAARRASCNLRDRVYAFGTLGLVEITDIGAKLLSQGIIGDVLPGVNYANDFSRWMTADPINNEIWLATGSPTVVYYIYNETQRAFATCTTGSSDGAAAYSQSSGVRFARENAAFRIDSFDTIGAAAVVDYQPVYAGDPLLAKQWIDMTLMFDTASAGIVVTPRFNGTASVGAALLNRQNDSRRNFGVTRNAPAIGHTLAPGFSLPAGGGILAQLRGLSLRFQPFGEQQVFR